VSFAVSRSSLLLGMLAGVDEVALDQEWGGRGGVVAGVGGS